MLKSSQQCSTSAYNSQPFPTPLVPVLVPVAFIKAGGPTYQTTSLGQIESPVFKTDRGCVQPTAPFVFGKNAEFTRHFQVNYDIATSTLNWLQAISYKSGHS